MPSLAPPAGAHVAQFNIARLVAPQGDPRVQPFFDAVARINALAERSPGFVWRLRDEAADPAWTAFQRTEPRMTATLSVWESVEAVQAFAHRTIHSRFFARRAEWFEKLEGPHLVMWPVAPGTRPDMGDALARLARLGAEGEGPEAFAWGALKAEA